MENKIYKNKQDFEINASNEEYLLLKSRYEELKTKKDFDEKYFNVYGFKVDSCRKILEKKGLIVVNKKNKNNNEEVLEMNNKELQFNLKEKTKYKNRTIGLNEKVIQALNIFCEEQYGSLNKNLVINTLLLQAIIDYADNETIAKLKEENIIE